MIVHLKILPFKTSSNGDYSDNQLMPLAATDEEGKKEQVNSLSWDTLRIP
jgi:hypothetical protein